MNITDFIVYANMFGFGWICCQFYITWKLRRALKKVAEENGMTLEELSEIYSESQTVKTTTIKVPNLFTESTNSSILCYCKDSGDFIAQANNVEELAEHIYKYNKIKFAYVNHNDDKVWFVEGKIRNNLDEIE